MVESFKRFLAIVISLALIYPTVYTLAESDTLTKVVANVVLSISDNIVTANFTSENNTVEDINVSYIVVAYDLTGAITDVVVENAVVNSGATSNHTSTINLPLGCSAKAFIWDESSMTPLCADEQITNYVIDINRYSNFQTPITVTPIPELEDREGDFICGMDVSSIWAVVQAGGVYYDMDGKKLIIGDEISNALAIMKKYGTNWVRIRVWNDVSTAPINHGAGGLNDNNVSLIIAKKAKALGLKLLLDFHYSDTWADPGRQIKPTAWTSIETIEELSDTLYNYTKDVLQTFVANGCMPEMVQIGNEINSGFLYHEMTGASSWASVSGGRPTGSSTNEASHIALIKAGIKAVRDVDPNNSVPDRRTKIMYHLADGNNIGMYNARASMLQRNNVDYDVMGASYYPYWHGSIAQITATLTSMATTYGKDVVIAETGWGFVTNDYTNPYGSTGPNLSHTFNNSSANTHPEFAVSPQGQADALRAIAEVVAKISDNKGLGVFYWEPAWIPTPRMGSGWAAGNSNIVMANQAYFDFAGRAMPSLTTWNRLFSKKD